MNSDVHLQISGPSHAVRSSDFIPNSAAWSIRIPAFLLGLLAGGLMATTAFLQFANAGQQTQHRIPPGAPLPPADLETTVEHPLDEQGTN